MRSLVIFIVMLVALTGSVVAALATREYRDTQLRGYVDATQTTELPYALPRLGVNASLEQYAPEQLEAQLNLMESANIRWVRQIVSWADIEPIDGDFNWERWDRIIEQVAERPNIELIAVLYGAPEWARVEAAIEHPTAPPASPDRFAQFAAAFAGRYGTQLDYYQIWDEPNLREAWGNLDPKAPEYAALLQASYSAIHSADADATVIAGALAPTTEIGPHNISDWRYLEALLDLGADNYFDAVGSKPYGFDASAQDRTVAEGVLNFSRVVRLREIMEQHGLGHKPIWASNWGWNSLPTNWQGEASIWGNVSATEQVEYTQAALDRADREWPWMAGMTLFHWQPDAALDDPIWGFALIDPTGDPTALLNALQSRPASDLASNGLYPPQSPHSEYSGVWTFSDFGADVGWLDDSRLAFTFSGTDVSLLVREGDYIAYLYPKINDTPANRLPRDAAGNAYLILTSDTLEPEIQAVPLARNLPPGTHILEATADRGSDQWALVGYGVSSGDLTAPYDRQIRIAWLTAAVALTGVIISGWQVQWGWLTRPIQRLSHRLDRSTRLIVGAVTSLILLLGMFMTWGDGTPALLRRTEPTLLAALLTAGVIYLQPPFVIVLVALVVLFVLIFNHLDVGLILTVLWTPFFLFPVQLYLFAFPVAEVVLLLTFGAWALRLVMGWAARYKGQAYTTLPTMSLNAIDGFAVGLVILATLSLVWTTYRDPALTEMRTLIVEPVMFYIIARSIMRTPTDAKMLANTLLMTGIIVSVVSIILFIINENVITAEGGARRLAGIYGSPNNLALFLGRVLPFALAYALLPDDRLTRWLGIGTLAISLPAFALTQSVGGLFIGVPAAFVVVTLLALRRKALAPIVVSILVGGLLFAYLSRFPRFGGVLDFTTGTNFRRLRVWQSGINIVRDYPLTGLGLDQFLYAFRGHYILPDAWQEPNLSHPHNFILDFWIRLGALGMILFFALQVFFWRRISELMQQPPQPTQRLILIGVSGAMVNVLAHGLVDNSYFVNDLAIVFMLLLALLQAISITPATENAA